MRQRGNSAGGKFPLKADHDVDEDQHQGENHGQCPALGELFADLRTNGLDPFQIDIRDADGNRSAQRLT